MLKRIKTVNKEMLKKTLRTGGCGECPASCQSACKTSCTVEANQVCEKALGGNAPLWKSFARGAVFLYKKANYFVDS